MSNSPDRMENSTGPLLDLSHVAPDVIAKILGGISLRDRFNCALVCKVWADAATRSIISEHRMQDLSGLQTWLERHGHHVTVLHVHECNRAALTALPCCAQLQDLLLNYVSIAGRTWGDIGSSTQLTSVSLQFVQTASPQADVVSALAALTNLEQLTWHYVHGSNEQQLSDSSLLQQLTQLTCLDLQYVTAAALQHLGSLTKLQHLSISDAQGWGPAGCPGLQELKALTSLKLASSYQFHLPASASQLTALRQLEVHRGAPTALNGLHILTNLTQLCVRQVTSLSPESPPLQLPGLQHLELEESYVAMPMSMSFLASCRQLQFLKLQGYHLQGPGSLVTSTMLQHLELHKCSISAAVGAADPVSWQQVFSGPGQLPHLTYLQLRPKKPAVQQADINSMVECCSNLRVLCLSTLKGSFAPALARSPGLTSLRLVGASAGTIASWHS